MKPQPDMSARAARIPAIDALRGGALVGMFAFHLTWDLGYFGLIPEQFPYSPPVMTFGHAVAIAFLALSGASLALAARGGVNWRAWWRRLAAITAAAGGITLATLWLFPDSYIFFGVLHCIAVSGVVALAFLRAPIWTALLAAALMALAPLVASSAALDNLFGWSLGLAAQEPRSNDWRPLLPWGAATLAGLGLSRLALAHGLPAWLIGWRAENLVSKSLVFGGRHSLLAYLIHQPLFFGMVYVAALAVGQRAPPEPTEETLFQDSCQHSCSPDGKAAALCARICACVADKAKQSGLWRPAMDGGLTPAQNDALNDDARSCAAAQASQ